MKALILNFRSFAGKKETNKDKLYFTFDMYDIEGKVLYNRRSLPSLVPTIPSCTPLASMLTAVSLRRCSLHRML